MNIKLYFVLSNAMEGSSWRHGWQAWVARVMKKQTPASEFFFPMWLLLPHSRNHWIEKIDLKTVVQGRLPEEEMDEFQTEFKQIPEANIFKSKITPEIRSGLIKIM